MSLEIRALGSGAQKPSAVAAQTALRGPPRQRQQRFTSLSSGSARLPAKEGRATLYMGAVSRPIGAALRDHAEELVVALGHLPHTAAGSTDAAYAVFSRHATLGDEFLRFLLPTVFRNTVGGEQSWRSSTALP